VVGYNPVNWSNTNSIEEAIADVQVETDAVTPAFRVMTVQIKGSAIHYVRRHIRR